MQQHVELREWLHQPGSPAYNKEAEAAVFCFTRRTEFMRWRRKKRKGMAVSGQQAEAGTLRQAESPAQQEYRDDLPGDAFGAFAGSMGTLCKAGDDR